MPRGVPDYWQATYPGMPVSGVGQVPWYLSDKALVTSAEYKDLLNYEVPAFNELHVCSGLVSCNVAGIVRFDLRQTPAGSWISPIGHSDPSDVWDYEANAYDGSLTTAAFQQFRGPAWGDFLELLINAQFVDKVRFHPVNSSSFVDQVDVDVYYGGAWHHVYQGTYDNSDWVEKAIPAGTQWVSKARIRYYNSSAELGNGFVREFEFDAVSASAQEGIAFNTVTVIPYLPQAPYLVAALATFVVRVYNDLSGAATMSVALAGFLQAKV